MKNRIPDRQKRMATRTKINPPDVVERLMQEHQPIVAFFASIFARRDRWVRERVQWDDLIAFGKIGLREAAKRYDPEKGKFGTYAWHWIKKYFHEAAKEQAELDARFSFDAPIGDGGISRHEVIADKTAEDPVAVLQRRDLLEGIRHMLDDAGLDAREKEIIVQRYTSDKNKTREQIANELGLTRQRIGQIENAAIAKLIALGGK